MIEREERDGERTRDREEGREPSIGQYIIVALGGRTTERESLKLEKKKNRENELRETGPALQMGYKSAEILNSLTLKFLLFRIQPSNSFEIYAQKISYFEIRA